MAGPQIIPPRVAFGTVDGKPVHIAREWFLWLLEKTDSMDDGEVIAAFDASIGKAIGAEARKEMEGLRVLEAFGESHSVAAEADKRAADLAQLVTRLAQSQAQLREMEKKLSDLMVVQALQQKGSHAHSVNVANEATDTTGFLGFVTAAAGSLPVKTNTNMTFNSATGVVTLASSILTTTDINGGTVDGTAIGGASASTIAGTTISASGQITSTVATGTAPLVIASTTKVANLNADLLDDQSGAFYLDSANFTGTNWTDLTDGGTTTLHTHISGVASSITVANEATDISCFPVFVTAATGDLGPKSNAGLTFNSSTGALTATSFVGPLTGNVTGDVSGTSATVTGAAQTAITSVGTLTALQVDNVNIDGNTISSTAGVDLLITPLAGQQIVLDGTIVIDAGVVTGATSITSTAFVGALTGNADTVTTNANLTGPITSVGNATTVADAQLASLAALTYTGNSLKVVRLNVGETDFEFAAVSSTVVTVADEATDTTCFPLFVTAATGDLGPKSNAGLAFNSSTGALTVTSVTTDTIVSSGTTATVFNTVATTVNAFGAATTLSMGATTGPKAIGGTALNYAGLAVLGTITSGGASTVAVGAYFSQTVIGTTGDTSSINHVRIDPFGITTQGATEVIGVVASLHVKEPIITVGAGDTITNAVTVYIQNAPTEGSGNYAFFIDSGSMRHDGSLWVESTPTEGTAGEQLTSGGAAAVMTWAAAACIEESKRDIHRMVDADAALAAILGTPIYGFHYKEKNEQERPVTTGDTETNYVGPMAHEAPWAMHHGGRILNPINALGYTILGMQALDARLAALEAR